MSDCGRTIAVAPRVATTIVRSARPLITIVREAPAQRIVTAAASLVVSTQVMAGGDALTTANVPVAAGVGAGVVVRPTAVPGATSAAAHLFSITVPAFDPDNLGAVIFTDGPGGAVLAVIPANFPGGDVHLTAPKFFGTSVYATPNGSAPAYSIGVGP